MFHLGVGTSGATNCPSGAEAQAFHASPDLQMTPLNSFRSISDKELELEGSRRHTYHKNSQDRKIPTKWKRLASSLHRPACPFELSLSDDCCRVARPPASIQPRFQWIGTSLNFVQKVWHLPHLFFNLAICFMFFHAVPFLSVTLAKI